MIEYLIGTGIASAFCMRKWFEYQAKRPKIKIIQGTKISKPTVVTDKMRAKGKQPDDVNFYLWGDEFLSEEEASLHFLALGSTGSGKTINIMLLLKTVVARMLMPNTGVRALVYDSKTDLLSQIRGTGISEENIIIMNPFDRRRSAWKIAEDIVTAGQAEDMASILAPSDPNSNNPYFAETAQELLSGMIIAFQQNAPKQWTLRDLIIASRDSERIKAILSSCRYTKDLTSHFRAKDTSENVSSTLATKLGKFSSIAASWEGADRHFTIDDWLNSQTMVVLGNSPKAKKPIRSLNQLMFSSISKAVIEIQGTSKAKHWFFLDELRELGALDMLGDMMTVGRSKGASMVLGFQDMNGLQAEYGKDKALELVGQAGNFALLRINATQTETQRWASQVAGQLRWERESKSTSFSNSEHGVTTGVNKGSELRTDEIFIPSFFSQSIPRTNFENGMRGVYFSKKKIDQKIFSGEILFTDRGTTNRLPSRVESFNDHEPFVPDMLEPWNEDDYQRLGFTIPEVKANREDIITDVSEVLDDALGGISI